MPKETPEDADRLRSLLLNGNQHGSVIAFTAPLNDYRKIKRLGFARGLYSIRDQRFVVASPEILALLDARRETPPRIIERKPLVRINAIAAAGGE